MEKWKSALKNVLWLFVFFVVVPVVVMGQGQTFFSCEPIPLGLSQCVDIPSTGDPQTCSYHNVACGHPNECSLGCANSIDVCSWSDWDTGQVRHCWRNEGVVTGTVCANNPYTPANCFMAYCPLGKRSQ